MKTKRRFRVSNYTYLARSTYTNRCDVRMFFSRSILKISFEDDDDGK